MERLYLTINKHGRHVQYADKNEDNYVCNVESNDADAEEIVRRVNSHDNLISALQDCKDFISTGHLSNEEMFEIIENAIQGEEKIWVCPYCGMVREAEFPIDEQDNVYCPDCNNNL